VPTPEDRLRAAADALGVAFAPSTFPAGTRTAAEAAAAVGCEVGAIVKSLVFVADGAPVLALVSGANRVDTARLAAAVDADAVRKADADEARAATGFAIGGTPPFGHTGTGVTRVVCDPDLLDHPTVWAAGGGPTSVFPLAPADLVRASGATVAPIAEAASA
jgi:prolyl-tRNA editing enzyme YbaK/EbsC (Cys-tRNA(Pro) deacylase)